MPIRVLHVYKTAKPLTQGGIEEVLDSLSQDTSAFGYESTVVCLHNGKSLQRTKIRGTTIIAYPKNFEIKSCGFSWQLWFDFTDLCSSYDLVHYQFPWPFADLLALFRQPRRIPYVVTYQSDIVRQKILSFFYTPFMHAFLKRAKKIIATSPNYVQTSSILRAYKRKLSIIPNGIIEHVEEKTESNARTFDDICHKKFFLFLGVLRYYKGVKYLLEAAKETDATIVIAGDGPERESLDKIVANEKLNNVIFVGHVSDQEKQRLLSSCYAFVLPSSYRSEAYGMVLLEAASYGKPLVTTELGSGTSYINVHNQTGLVIPAKDSDALSTAMNKLMNQPDTASLMGQKAYQRYSSLFTVDVMLQEYSNLYREAIETQ